MTADFPLPECPNLPPELIAYLRSTFTSAVGTFPREVSAYHVQVGEQRVVEHLANQLERQRQGEPSEL